MAMLKLYKCDASDCTETTVKEPKVQRPHGWLRVTINAPGTDEAVTGAFHDVTCAHAWLDDLLDVPMVMQASDGVAPKNKD